MKTWQQFVEAKAMLAPMAQQPAEYQPGYKAPSTRRSASLSLTPQQQAAGAAAHQAAQPVSDEEMGAQYAKSMQIQQARAKAQMGRRV